VVCDAKIRGFPTILIEKVNVGMKKAYSEPEMIGEAHNKSFNGIATMYR